MKGEHSLNRARITYMFRETFRAHSRNEYREFLTRGLGGDRLGITGTYPWLYVRIFFVLFILFTINTLILRFTGNTMYVPTVTLLAGITFLVPFIVLLYEIYPKRDLSSIKLFGILVLGGTAAGILTQIGYALIKTDNVWADAFITGLVEEVSKASVAVAAISIMKNKNSYACFLIAAAVGAGFSVIEDMGYIFFYSDMVAASYGDIRNTVYLFLDRGFSALCTHVLWTGIVGWAYGFKKGKYKPLFVLLLIFSIFIHSCWNLPFTGWEHSGIIAICTILTLFSNIVAVRKSLFVTMSDEFDIARINENIIREAKEMGERMRFTNAANLTFALMCTLLAAIALAMCCLPIGMEKTRVTYNSPQEFISVIEGGYNLKHDWLREYDPDGKNTEERYIDDGDGLRLSYRIQEVTFADCEGTYFYGYYIDENGNADGYADSVYLELDDIASRIPCIDYVFGDETLRAFDVTGNDFSDYIYNSDGTVSAVIDAEAFNGYNLLIGLIAAATGIAAACFIILFAFTIKLKKVKDD